MTLWIPLVLALLSQGLRAVAQTTNAQFNQVINLNGDMTLNSVQFPDGSRIETFSQTQRQMLVNQNQAPLPGNQVTGTTGNPFMQLSTNSLIIQTNGATDLVGAQIELPINSQITQQNGITPDNTFVAKLAQDRQSWMVMDTIKTVNNTDNTVRIVKMNNIDGEYIALGRQTSVTGVALTQFGSDPTTQFNATGSGIQENEFSDGFRMSVRASQPTIINLDVKNGISTTMLSALEPGTQSINNYRYLVTTNLGGVAPNINRMAAVMQIPINPLRLQTVAKNLGAGAQSNVRLSIAQRGILTNPGGAQGISTPQRRQDGTSAVSNSTGSGTIGETNTSSSETGQTNGNIGPGIVNNPAATTLLLSPTFTPIKANAVFDTVNGRLAIPVTQVDGEYIITIAMAGGAAVPAAAQPATAPQAASPQTAASTAPNLAPASASQKAGTGAQPTIAEPSGAVTPAASSVTTKSGSSARTSESASAATVPAASVSSTSPKAASSPSSSFVFRRQAPALPQAQADGSVIVSMDWINYMAAIQVQGGVVNVGEMMASLGVAPAAAPPPLTAATTGSISVSGLVGALRARKFRA